MKKNNINHPEFPFVKQFDKPKHPELPGFKTNVRMGKIDARFIWWPDLNRICMPHGDGAQDAYDAMMNDIESEEDYGYRQCDDE